MPFTSPVGAPALPSPTIVGPAGANFVCIVGTVNLFRFIQPPRPGGVIGVLSLPRGGSIALTQTLPAVFGGPSLAAVDGGLATVCGNLVAAEGRVALDVRFVAPGVSPLTPGVDPLALLLLLLATGAVVTAAPTAFPGAFTAAPAAFAGAFAGAGPGLALGAGG